MKPLRPPRLALAASLAGLGCLAWALPPGAIPPAAGPGPPAGEPVGELIRRLGGDDFEAREAATRGLLGRADAAAALRAAAKSPSPEVRRGVARILGEIDRRRVSGALAEAVTLVNRGAVDEAVERLVRWGEWDADDSGWEAATRLAARLVDAEGRLCKRARLALVEGRLGPREPLWLAAGDFRRYRKQFRPVAVAERRPHLRESGGFLVRAELVTFGGRLTACGLVLSSGKVCAEAGPRSNGMLDRSLVFAGGDVEVNEAWRSVVVCDGEFRARRGLYRTLVIARGPIRCGERVNQSTLISGGAVQLSRREESFATIRQEEANPLGLVRFFDPARAGVEVTAAKGGVRVKHADKGKPFAKAGLRAGDLVVTLDGSAVPTPESFRRVLRGRLAEGEEMVFKVRRSGKVLEVRVPCGD